MVENILHSTLDAISANVAVLERDGTILNVNAYWRRFGLANGAQSPTGYCQENYLAICDAAIGAHAEEAQRVAAGIRAVIAGSAEQFYLEYPCHSPTEERWYGLRVTPFAEPVPRRVVVAHVNITERVQAELAERKQRHFTQALLDSLAALTGALNVDQALQQILAATANVIPSDAGSIILFEEDLCRVAYLRGYAPETEAYFKEARFPLATLVCGEETLQGRSYFVPDTQTADNWVAFSSVQWVRSSIGVPIQLHGQVIGLICVDSAMPNYFQPADVDKLQAFARYASLALQNAQHVSQLEMRVAERTTELQAAKERVEAILNHSFDGILLVRPDLRIEQTNAAFNQMLGVPFESFTGVLSDLIHADELPQVQTLLQRVLATQKGEQLETRCYQKNGRVYDAELSIGPIKSEGMVCTLRDITEHKQAEAALRESEALYRLLAENSTDWISCVNANMEFTYVSPSAQLLGYEPNELLGQTWFGLIHPDDLSTLYAMQMNTLTQRPTTIHLIYRLRHKAGYYRWIETNGRILYHEETEEIIGSIGASRDITERKEAEDALRKSENSYRLLAENVTDLIGCTNAVGICTYISPSCRTLLGYEPEEMIGQPAYQFIHPDDLHLLQATHSAVLTKTAPPPILTYRMRHKAGHYLWMEMSSQNICDPVTGEVIEFVNVAREITERKRIEDALRESEQQYRHLVEAIQGGLIISGTDNRTTYINDRFCELIGYTREEILGHPATDFVDAENAKVLRAQAVKRAQGESSSYEVTLHCKNGQPLHVLAAASPLRNDQQEIIGIIAVVLDIETQKRAEAALRENLRKEKELGELKSRFISMASHEFRTPLASILAITDTIIAYRHKLTDAQIDQRLRKIQEQIGYLKGIMEDVLQLARLQARRAEFNPVQLDLDALCRNVVEEFQNNPEQAKRLVYQGDPALQPSLVDQKLMRQVINNLIANGLKYSPVDKLVTITLAQAANQLVLTVQDQGIGIPAADLPHLFEPFHRAANVGTIAGTGLGLVITKESVELHGGTITVQSQSDIGTTVAVTIPYVTNNTTPAQAAELIAMD